MQLEATREIYNSVMVPTYDPAPFIPVAGYGSRLWDQSGNEYVDFAGGIAVHALGHCHPALVEAVRAQSQRLWHTSNVYANEPAIRLAQALTQATFADRVFFANSGAEANEAAFKLARRYGINTAGSQKHEIIAATNSFHGRTLFTVSVAGQAKYSDGFGPAISGIRHVPFNDIEALEHAVSERTCAVVLEPVLGESGVIPADKAYLRQARHLCEEHDALLIFDEVQTGMGRVGTLFAYEHFGVQPDVLTAAKAIGGGFPLAAMLTTDHLAKHLGAGVHGSTYGGNPLACAVGEASLLQINKPHVLAGVRTRHNQLKAGLEEIGSAYGLFEEVRGLGLLLGCVLADPWKGTARYVMEKCQENGLLVLQAGTDVIRLAPSLIIEEDDLKDGIARLEETARQLAMSTRLRNEREVPIRG